MAMNDEQFAQFESTGKLDDQKFSHPALVEIRATTLRRNLETAGKRREEKKIAEANRQQAERLALEATRLTADEANAAKQQAAERIRSKLIGSWRWGVAT
jgi:hypothetical protein